MDLEANALIGDFQIEKRLGAGATGVVYRARQITLDRVVALKIMGNSLARQAEIARFRREAQAIARLNHTGIAEVYYVGQDQHVCYMAMELVEGTSLNRLIEGLVAVDDPRQTIDSVLDKIPAGEGPGKALRFDQADDGLDDELDVGGLKSQLASVSPQARQLIESKNYIERCCEMVCDAAEALAHAHDQGVIHRDIKPANLLVDRSGRIHIIDFGIARFFEDTTLTQTGALVGTPMYMAPEQLTGRLAADRLSDVYSLGLVLYELLALVPPIRATTREGIIREIMSKPLRPISWLNRGVPRKLESVVHRATDKDTDERYPSAALFAADLKRYRNGEPVTATAYRYKFDEREIAAERPKEALAVAFTFQFCAIAAVILGGISIIRRADSVPLFSSDFNATVLASLTVSGWLYWVGSGLLAGQKFGRRAALGTCVASLSIAVIVPSLFLGYPMSIQSMTGTLALIPLVLSSPILLVLHVLYQKKTLRWFDFCEQLRSEYKKERLF